MRPIIAFILLGLLAGLTGCAGDDGGNKSNPAFHITISNISRAGATGVFNTPVGAGAAGVAMPGASYEFTFPAVNGDRLSFASMLVASNDLFFAPPAAGLPLFAGGTAVTGDVTGQLTLWDAGTEQNQDFGTGSEQPANGAGSTADSTATVRALDYTLDAINATYPAAADVLTATLSHDAMTGEFTLTIAVSTTSASPISPGAFVVHRGGDPIFTSGVADRGLGLEALAEGGDPSGLEATLTAWNAAWSSPLAPGAWAVHDFSGINTLFSQGGSASSGLEAMAEDGDPSGLLASIQSATGVQSAGVFNTPDGLSAPGVAHGGESYSFTVDASLGDLLTFGTMFVQSNDLFFAPLGVGISLFDLNGDPQVGDVTSSVFLWDAGTEVNELPGGGANQAPRQGAANTGTTEGGTVEFLSAVNDGFHYPGVTDMIQVTISYQ